MTAFTPGSASAFEVSIETIRACAWGLRSTRPTSWPGRLKSAPNRARPVTLSTPSGRTVRVPTYVWGRSCSVVVTSAMSAPPHVGGRVHHRLDVLVVPRAAAEIARQPEAYFRLGRLEIPLEQRLGRDEHARRADAALERGVLEELLLERMEPLPAGHALDRLDPPTPDLAAQHEAGADEPAVQRDAAGAAVARGTALLAPGQAERVAEDVEERFLRLAEELDVVSIHRRFDVVLGHQWLLARSSAIRAARRVSTPATWVRNSTVPRLSSIGRHAARAAASSRCCAASSSVLPMMARAASATSRTFSATAPSDTRAAVTVPRPSTVRFTPDPTTAMSISVRGMKRRYASAEPI